MKIIAIYDDTGRKSEVIADIIGEKGFADVVVKKRRLEEYYQDEVTQIYPNVIWKKVGTVFAYAALVKEMEQYKEEVRVLHCFSK